MVNELQVNKFFKTKKWKREKKFEKLLIVLDKFSLFKFSFSSSDKSALQFRLPSHAAGYAALFFRNFGIDSLTIVPSSVCCAPPKVLKLPIRMIDSCD